MAAVSICEAAASRFFVLLKDAASFYSNHPVHRNYVEGDHKWLGLEDIEGVQLVTYNDAKPLSPSGSSIQWKCQAIFCFQYSKNGIHNLNYHYSTQKLLDFAQYVLTNTDANTSVLHNDIEYMFLKQYHDTEEESCATYFGRFVFIIRSHSVGTPEYGIPILVRFIECPIVAVNYPILNQDLRETTNDIFTSSITPSYLTQKILAGLYRKVNPDSRSNSSYREFNLSHTPFFFFGRIISQVDINKSLSDSLMGKVAQTDNLVVEVELSFMHADTEIKVDGSFYCSVIPSNLVPKVENVYGALRFYPGQSVLAQVAPMAVRVPPVTVVLASSYLPRSRRHY